MFRKTSRLPVEALRESHWVTTKVDRPPASLPVLREGRHSLSQGRKANMDLSKKSDTIKARLS